MTTLVHRRARTTTLSAAFVIVAGCAALSLRTISYEATAITAAVGTAGALATRRHRATTTTSWCLVVFTLGTAAFAATRLIASPIGVRLTTFGILTIVVAAIAEEAFFRGFVYQSVERAGPVMAVLVTSLLFAGVHLPMYGAAAMPIDIAAGAVLSWQRWSTGTWMVPAATHVIANLLQMG